MQEGAGKTARRIDVGSIVNRACRFRLRFVEDIGDIRAQGQCDAKVRSGNVLAVVLQKALADVAGGDPNNGIFACVVGRGPAKQFDPNHSLLEGVKVAYERLIDNIGEELRASMAASKGFAVDDVAKMLAQCRDIRL